MIYTVTVVKLKDCSMKRHRTWGYFETQEEAEKSVLENHTDMFELGYYSHAVVEECSPGLLVYSEREWWYAATYPATDGTLFVNPEVRSIEKPLELENVVGFAMG